MPVVEYIPSPQPPFDKEEQKSFLLPCPAITIVGSGSFAPVFSSYSDGKRRHSLILGPVSDAATLSSISMQKEQKNGAFAHFWPRFRHRDTFPHFDEKTKTKNGAFAHIWPLFRRRDTFPHFGEKTKQTGRSSKYSSRTNRPHLKDLAPCLRYIITVGIRRIEWNDIISARVDTNLCCRIDAGSHG